MASKLLKTKCWHEYSLGWFGGHDWPSLWRFVAAHPLLRARLRALDLDFTTDSEVYIPTDEPSIFSSLSEMTQLTKLSLLVYFPISMLFNCLGAASSLKYDLL